MSHCNISIFVPHIGCKCRCSFCNQRYITGQSYAPEEKDVDDAVAAALRSKRYDRQSGQIAFFGGSFTAIERGYMIRLLKCAKRHIDRGNACGIRISTRPDAIDGEVLDILRAYGVQSVELGAQSMRDEVLAKNRRGHTAADVENAARLIKDYGLELGLQMMTGLYGDDDDGAVYTAERFIALRPDTVRIYPTVVLENTELCSLYRNGEYAPQTAEQAARLGAVLLKLFYDNNINVIRFGLHSIEREHYVAGAWHPALAELAYSRIYFKLCADMIKSYDKGEYVIYTAPSEISKMTGQKRSNLEMLRKMGYNCKVKADETLDLYELKILREE